MACTFGEIFNACNCLIGYTEPLQTSLNVDITNYPVNVISVTGTDLGTANSPSEYVSLWNLDTDNQAKGVLMVGGSAFCFVLSKIDGITPPSHVLGTFTPTVTFQYKYGATDADTTGAPLTEAQYIASVDNVFTAGNELTGGPLAHNAPTLPVAGGFGNVTDKVLFIQVPATEAAFIRWSEVGNALQQNQLIDASFGTGSAVWFKSSRRGVPIYITRSQTSFTGNIVLSR